jgi:hypothetical protein
LQLDVLIVVISIILAVVESRNVAAIKALRVLRALKPLRTLTHSAGMLLVLKSLTQSLGAMMHVSLLLFISFIIFGILGVELFAGKFYRCVLSDRKDVRSLCSKLEFLVHYLRVSRRCTDASVTTRDECVGQFLSDGGTVIERQWRKPNLNFDNLPRAIVSLFVTISLDGYSDLMVMAMTAPPEKGQNPLVRHRREIK